MLALLPALLLSAAPGASAAEHRVEVGVFDGRTPCLLQSFGISEGSQASFAGPVFPEGKGASKGLVLNALLTRDPEAKGTFLLQYQVELSNGPGKPGRSIQAQAEVALRPADTISAVECGPWRVLLSLDGAGRRKGRASWTAPGLGNYRLTADMTAGSSRQVCGSVFRLGTQANVADGLSKDGKKSGFILDSLVSPVRGGGYAVQYQVKHALDPAGPPVQAQGEARLSPGKKKRIAGKGYSLELLLESPDR